MLCVSTGVTVLVLATQSFTLDWTHSVAQTGWWERWQITEAGLTPVEARISGTGAGMEPPPDARLHDGAWHYTPQMAPQHQVILATSQATGAGWRLCAQGRCYDLPEDQGPLRLSSAEQCDN